MVAPDPSERAIIGNVVEHLAYIIERESHNIENASDYWQCRFGSAFLDQVFPELESTIQDFMLKMRNSAKHCRGLQDYIAHVFDRLEDLHDRLYAAENLAKEVAVRKFCRVLLSFDAYLRISISEISVVQRTESQKVSGEIDELLELLAMSVVDSIHDWNNQAVGGEESTNNDIRSKSCINSINSSKWGSAVNSSVNSVKSDAVKFLRYVSTTMNEKFLPIDISSSNHSDKVSPQSSWYIPIRELKYSTSDQIGVGSFSAVYKGSWLGTPVVVKFMGYEDHGDRYRREIFLHELPVWHPMSHPHAIKLFGACAIGKRYFVCEYASGGSLRDFSRKEHSSTTMIWQKLYEVSLGLQYVHQQNIIHNDLKCENFLVGADGRAKVIDFGLSCIPKSAEVKINPKHQGAIPWKSPEYLKRERLTLATDVYSFGMCILEVVTGSLLWGGKVDPAIKFHVHKGVLPL